MAHFEILLKARYHLDLGLAWAWCHSCAYASTRHDVWALTHIHGQRIMNLTFFVATCSQGMYGRETQQGP